MNSTNSIIHYPNFKFGHGPTFGPGPLYPVDPWMPPGDQFPMNPQPLMPQPMNPPLQLPYWNPAVPAVPSWWPETDSKTPRLTLCTTCSQMHHSETCPFCIRNALQRMEVEIGRMHQELTAFASGNEKLVRQMDALLTLTVERPKARKKAVKVKASKTRKSKKAKRK